MKKGFIIYKSLYEPIKALEREQKGELLEAIFEYQLTGNILEDMSPIVKMAFMFFKNQFDIDNEKYTERCVKAKESVNKRWEKERIQKDTTEYERIQPNTNNTDKREKKEDIREKVKDKEEDIREKKLPTLKTKTVFSEEVSNLYDIIIPLFPETTVPKNDSQASKWKDEIRKLLEVDKYDSPTIEHVVRMAREDDFWSGNFLSITKLRKKDKNMIPYIVVFIEKFKHKIKKKQTDFQVHQQAYLAAVENNGGIHPSKVDEHGQAY